MERARRIRALAKAQMRGVQRLPALGGERGRPCDGRTRAREARHALGGTLLPSRTANGVRGGAVSMAQRFFSGSGTTAFTSRNPADSGGR